MSIKVPDHLKKNIYTLVRRASLRWSPRSKAKQAAKMIVGEYKNGNPLFGYKCAHCKLGFRAKDIEMDHKEPVIPTDRSLLDLSLDELCVRFLPYRDGWQALCLKCHQIKTNAENEQRHSRSTDVKETNKKVSRVTKKTSRVNRKTSKKKRKKSRLGKS